MPGATVKASNSRPINWPCLRQPGRRGKQKRSLTKPDGSDDDDPNANPGADESASKKRTGAVSLFRGISSESALCMNWRKRKNTAPLVSRT
jgi:hypothetical protein